MGVACLYSLQTALLTFAQTNQGYVPPADMTRRTQSGRTSGSRGCDLGINAQLKLLVPPDHISLTASGHPTFLWYLSEKISVPILFTLAESRGAIPILEQQVKLEKPGIMRLKLPDNVPELVEGKEYQWTVTIVCNQWRDSENSYQQALVRRVPIAYQLKRKLKSVNSHLARGLLYAQAGIWYDALSTLYTENLEQFCQLLKQEEILIPNC